MCKSTAPNLLRFRFAMPFFSLQSQFHQFRALLWQRKQKMRTKKHSTNGCVPEARIAFRTSGHRGTATDGTAERFIAQAVLWQHMGEASDDSSEATERAPMPGTAQQTQLARRIDTHVRQVLAQGGGDEDFLMSLAASMGTFTQLLETCTGQRWTPSARAITASTALPGCWRGWPRVAPRAT